MFKFDEMGWGNGIVTFSSHFWICPVPIDEEYIEAIMSFIFEKVINGAKLRHFQMLYGFFCQKIRFVFAASARGNCQNLSRLSSQAKDFTLWTAGITEQWDAPPDVGTLNSNQSGKWSSTTERHLLTTFSWWDYWNAPAYKLRPFPYILENNGS